MANATAGRGACPTPYLQLSDFPSKLGCESIVLSTDAIESFTKRQADQPARFCAPVPTIGGPIDCCLPCPITDWVYSDGTSSAERFKRVDAEMKIRLRCPTHCCQLAQCSWHDMLCDLAHKLPCPARQTDQPALSDCRFRHRTWSYAGELLSRVIRRLR